MHLNLHLNLYTCTHAEGAEYPKNHQFPMSLNLNSSCHGYKYLCFPDKNLWGHSVTLCAALFHRQKEQSHDHRAWSNHKSESLTFTKGRLTPIILGQGLVSQTSLDHILRQLYPGGVTMEGVHSRLESCPGIAWSGQQASKQQQQRTAQQHLALQHRGWPLWPLWPLWPV